MTSPSLRRRLAMVVTVVAALAAGGARAQPAPPPAQNPEAEARQHYRSGLAHYDLGEYQAALEEFKDAYRAVQDPPFLFNIAQCHRKLGQSAEALTFYRSYLRRAPDAPNRAEVERSEEHTSE